MNGAFRIANVLALALVGWLSAARWSGGLSVALGLGAAILLWRAGEAANRRLFVAGLAIAAGGEIALRAISPVLDDNSFFRAPRPYVEFSGYPGASLDDPNPRAQGRGGVGTIAMNALGLRGPLPEQPKRDEFRIIVLGGSAVLLGTPLENALPGRVEAAFHARGRSDVRVYNWGVLSYVSGQELTLLVHEVARHDPDLVVVYSGANDVFQPFLYDPRPGYPYNWHVYEAGLRQMRGEASMGDFLDALCLRSRLVRRVTGTSLADRLTRLSRLREETGYGTADWRKRIAAGYLANTAKMKVVAAAAELRLAVFLQPMAALKARLTEREQVLLGGETLATHVKTSYALIREGRARQAMLQGAWFDLSEVFAERSDETFWDLVHVYDEANAVVASRIVEELERSGLSRPRLR